MSKEIELTRRRVLGGVTTIGVASAAAGAGTFAAFSDSESSGGNTISAGTLDLRTDGSNGVTGTISAGDVAPGASGVEYVQLTNVGTVPGSDILARLVETGNAEGANPDSETNTSGEGELDDHLVIEIGVVDDTDTGTSGIQEGTRHPAHGPAAYNTVEGAGYASTGVGLGGESNRHLYVEWSFPDSGNQNDAQGDSVEFEVTVLLQQ